MLSAAVPATSFIRAWTITSHSHEHIWRSPTYSSLHRRQTDTTLITAQLRRTHSGLFLAPMTKTLVWCPELFCTWARSALREPARRIAGKRHTAAKISHSAREYQCGETLPGF